MITKEDLKAYAKKLMFTMKEEEYDTLMDEFSIILKQMDFISEIVGIEEIEPMTFPYLLSHAHFRKDEEIEMLSTEEVLKNAKEVSQNQVKVPKVVEE